MIQDAQRIDDGADLRAEVCIIGAGAAGITLARELIGHEVRAIVLESGGAEPELDTLDLARGEQSGIPYFPLESARLRMLGGTTNHWGGLCRPFDAADFAPQEWLPGGGWPISLADIEPYYERAAEICGLPVADWSVDRWERESPHDVAEVSDRFEHRVALQVPTARRSFGTAFRDDLERAGNITVLLHANAIEIEANPEATHVSRVRVATLSGRAFTVTAPYVVLAAGGIENPRILLASRGQSRNGLGNGKDQVGRHFMEHPRFEAAVIVPGEGFPVDFYRTHRAGPVSIQGYLALTDEVRERDHLIDVQLRLRADYERTFAEAQDSAAVESARRIGRMVRGDMPDDLAADVVNILEDMGRWQPLTVSGGPIPVPAPEAVGAWLDGTDPERRALLAELVGHLGVFGAGRVVGAPFESITVIARLAQVPNPDSRITLAREVDALGMPRARLNWALTRTDRESTIRVLERFGAEVGRAGYGRLRMLIDADGSDWPDDIAGGYHLMGTTRMHADANHGVVDGEGRVHGIDNLYVAGSSVFAYGASGTPTMTLVALTLRLADHLRTRLEG